MDTFEETFPKSKVAKPLGLQVVAVDRDMTHHRLVPRKLRSPQEKKTLSLRRDCRNTYGNSQKAARKAIPLRKALENRRNRHKNNQAIAQAERTGEAALAIAESSARHDLHRLGGWRKDADEPLGAVVKALEARASRFGRKVRARRSDTIDG